MREVAAVAGWHWHFWRICGNKEALAALTIHIRVKALAQAPAKQASKPVNIPLWSIWPWT